MPDYRVFVRDSAYNVIGELDAWTDAEFIPTFNDVGTWRVEVPTDRPESVLLNRTVGILVRRDNVTIFSGWVDEFERTSRQIVMSGRSDMALLETPTRPVPAQAVGPYADEYHVMTDQASQVMHQLVIKNIGNDAPAPWKIPALLNGPDLHLGATITSRARFQPILTILQELAATPMAGGLGFSLLQSDTVANHIDFNVYAPVDRSADVKFGVHLDTARDFSDRQVLPDATYVMVGLGDGLGAGRTVLEDGDDALEASLGRRIARFVDARDIDDPSEGNQRLAEALAAAVIARKVTIEPIDVPSLEYGTDYDLGDVVTFSVETAPGVYETFVDLIRAVRITLTTDRGAIAAPMVGEAGANFDNRTARHIMAVQDRVLNLERNWTVPDDSITPAMLTAAITPPVGQVVAYAGHTPPAGWIICQGQEVLRSTYGALFAVIGTLYGPGNGSTTFNVPDARGRVLLGVSAAHPIATVGGSDTVDASHAHASQAHTHPGSHSHDLGGHTHASQAHTHPGSHSHGIGGHSHGLAGHIHNIDHNHPLTQSGGVNIDTVAVGHASLGSGTTDHHHGTDLAPLGPTNSGVPSPGTTDPGSGSTDPDSNAPAASYGGSPGAASPNSTGADTNAPAASYSGSPSSGGSTTLPNLPPFVAMNMMIYAGV